MAHKTAERRHRTKPVETQAKPPGEGMQDRRQSCEELESTKRDEELEITERFVDETDRATFAKVHVLKTRSSSEQNLMLTTSTLRKGGYKSMTKLSQKSDCDRLNNNSTSQNKNQMESYKLNKSTGCISERCDEKKEESEVRDFKKNANVYSVHQGKTVLKERRRSLPTLPKLIGQKLHEHNQKTMLKSSDSTDLVAAITKDIRDRTFRTLSRGIGRLLKRHSSVNISEPDPVFKVAYLGNVLTGWAKGEGCVDKPLSTLWRNYNQSTKPDVVMKLSITNSGLKGLTKEHGLTEYWAHRITFCTSPPEFPKIFCWVYRHEGRKLKHELRCHAVLCSKETVSKRIATELQNKIHQALIEFKRDKIARQNARLSLANCVYENPSLPRRKILLSVGGNNYKPPLERSKSAPKLMAIEEICSEEDEEEEEADVEKNTKTWTKQSTQKIRHKTEEMYPSYSLGRRRTQEFTMKLSLPPETKVEQIDDPTKDDFRENNETQLDQKIAEKDEETPDTEGRFSYSNASDEFAKLLIEEEDNEVFYCETDDRLKKCVEEDEEEVKADNCDKSMADQLCPQTNFIVLDSDEGSISSGCETASTVTSSDIEMSSLPNIQQEYKYPEKKMSVLERVQSFEQLFLREREDSLRSSRSSTKHFQKAYGDLESASEATSLSPSDSACYSSGETGPPSCDDEVNLEPLGEKYRNFRTAYLRCSTYPPDDQLVTGDDQPVAEECQKYEEVDQTGADSDSACSVESGYSELLESIKFEMQKPNYGEKISHLC